MNLSGESASSKHVTSADAFRNLDWATSTCILGFTVFGKAKSGSFTSNLHSGARKCPYSNGAFVFMQASGTMVKMAPTLMLCAGHLTANSWRLPMTLAKSTCSLTLVHNHV